MNAIRDSSTAPLAAVAVLVFPRHFAWLAAAALAAGIAHRLGAPGGTNAAGWYGALHAATIVAAWRGSARWPRKAWFVAGAAAWCAIAVRVGMLSNRGLDGSIGRLHWVGHFDAGFAPSLCLTSTLGAAGYAALFRLLGRRFTVTAMVGLSLGCSVATVALLVTGGYHRLGGTGFALVWWCAFSIGLWVLDRRCNDRFR